jgi:hypothetical protein
VTIYVTLTSLMSIVTLSISRMGPAIGAAGVSASFGWEMDAVGRDIIRGRLGRGETAGNFHDVVVPTEFQVFAEEKILNEAVSLHGAREDDASW